MRRTRAALLLLALTVALVTVAGLGAPSARAGTLGEQLERSLRELRRAEVRLTAAETAFAAALAARQNRGTGLLVKEMRTARHAVVFWCRVVAGLRRVRSQRATDASLARAGDWRALIARAARKYGVSADGLYRLMIMESGGRARAVGAGRYYGLFQYSIGTWRGTWNPWRGESVFDGSAQIEASAFAVKKGMGPGLWGNTYPAAF
jgi:soluble lytic murein transglycosylase-like protein